MNDEVLRLEALKLAAQTLSPNAYSARQSLLVTAKLIFEYIKKGKYALDVDAED